MLSLPTSNAAPLELRDILFANKTDLRSVRVLCIGGPLDGQTGYTPLNMTIGLRFKEVTAKYASSWPPTEYYVTYYECIAADETHCILAAEVV